MELISNNIHMDTVKCKTVFQVSLEDDVNLKEDSQDINRIITQDGMVQISECKATADHLTIKGNLLVDVLYLTDDEKEVLSGMNGKLSFEEVIYAEGMKPTDTVDLIWKIEDLSVSMINSRKISIRSLITFTSQVDVLYDEVAGVDLVTEVGEQVECQKEEMQIAKLSVCKKDVCHIHQELTLPGGYPNVYRVLYKFIRLANVQYKPKKDMVCIDGDLEIFLLYDSADEDENIRYYEQSVPFHNEIECQDSREDMTLDLKWNMLCPDLEIRPDFDGEERMICMDVNLQLCMKLYEEETISILSDVYGIRDMIETTGKKGSFCKLLMHSEGIAKVEHTILMDSDPAILQVLFVLGDANIEDYTMQEDGVLIEGIINIKCLYITQEDKYPYMAKEESIPFSYLLTLKKVQKDCICNMDVSLDQLLATVTDANELQIKATVKVKGLFMEAFEKQLLTDVAVAPRDRKNMPHQPGIVLYFVQPGDSLYRIGKRFSVPICSIMEQNRLESDSLTIGQQLMIMR